MGCAAPQPRKIWTSALPKTLRNQETAGHAVWGQRDQIGARLVTMQAGNPSLQSPHNAGIGVAAATAGI